MALEATQCSTVVEWIPEGTILYPGAGYTYYPYYRWLDNNDEAIILRKVTGKVVAEGYAEVRYVLPSEFDSREWEV